MPLKINYIDKYKKQKTILKGTIYIILGIAATALVLYGLDTLYIWCICNVKKA